MSRFNLDTTIVPPIEVEIGGQVYLIRKMDKPLLDQLQGLEENRKAGDPTFFHRQLLIMLDAPEDVIKSLDVRKVKELAVWINDQITAPLPKDKVEKNGSKPGEGVSAS